MASCSVNQEPAKKYYHPGDKVAGKLIVYDTSKIRDIRVQLTGVEHTGWDHYTGDNVFLRVEKQWTGEDITPGREEYPFLLTLPNRLPATFRNTYGWIKFFIKATVYETGATIEDVKEIQVVAPVRVQKPITYHVPTYLLTKNSGNWIFPEKITMEFTLAKNHFVLGEELNGIVNINNSTRKAISYVFVAVLMSTESKVKKPCHDSKDEQNVVISKSKYPGVRPYEKETYHINLLLPESADVHNFTFCKLFSQTFTIEVTSFTSLGVIKIPVEITVGHIPPNDRGNSHKRSSADSTPSLIILYPISEQKRPSPAGDNPCPYPVHMPPTFPQPIGFTLAEPGPSTSHSPLFPSAPPTSLHRPVPGPSAPPMWDDSSTREFTDSTPLIGPSVASSPPPSYEEAMAAAAIQQQSIKTTEKKSSS